MKPLLLLLMFTFSATALADGIVCENVGTSRNTVTEIKLNSKGLYDFKHYWTSGGGKITQVSRYVSTDLECNIHGITAYCVGAKDTITPKYWFRLVETTEVTDLNQSKASSADPLIVISKHTKAFPYHYDFTYLASECTQL